MEDQYKDNIQICLARGTQEHSWVAELGLASD